MQAMTIPDVTSGQDADTSEPSTPGLILGSGMLALVVQHLRAALPNEGVCLLATIGAFPVGSRRAMRIYPGTNIDRSPTRYTMHPREVAAALRDMAANGWNLGAIAHSHPQGPPTPSPTDLRERYYPDAWFMIVSFATPGSIPEVRTWTVRETDGVPGIEERPVRLES